MVSAIKGTGQVDHKYRIQSRRGQRKLLLTARRVGVAISPVKCARRKRIMNMKVSTDTGFIAIVDPSRFQAFSDSSMGELDHINAGNCLFLFTGSALSEKTLDRPT